MKSFLAALLITVPALAHAYTWDQTLPLNSVAVTPSSSYSFTHDLTAPGVGFNVGSDTISDYKLILSLTNDQGLLDVVTIDQPGSILTDGFALLYNWKAASVTTQGSLEGTLSLNSTGKLALTVSSLFGSFFLDSSELIATGTQGASVPEPASVALLAVGLVGIAVMRRTSRAA